ncbi:MAG: Uma2 family endonuclease [Pirellula sp.]
MSAVVQGITLAQYHAREMASQQKHEYFRGEVFAMVGGSPRHSLIATNFCGEARQQLKGKPCVPYNSDLRIKIEATGLFTYTDASIVCGPLLCDPELSSTVLNPSVIVEVLSESTEKYDRGRKASHYRQILSLKDLILISQEEVSVERYTRQSDGNWLFVEYRTLDQYLELESVGVVIPLAEIYRNIVFDSNAGPK